jgi:nucleoside-triphosphatase THEP1
MKQERGTLIPGRQIIIITADRGAGKTSFIRRIVSHLRDGGIAHAGFYAEGTWRDDERQDFSLHLLPSGENLPLCDRITDSWIPLGRFFFNPEALRQGYNAVMEARPGDVIIMDEIGVQEINGSAWADALNGAIRKNNPLILSVRHRHLPGIINTWHMGGAIILNGNDVSWENLFKKILSEITRLTAPAENNIEPIFE